MKKQLPLITLLIILSACTSTQKLTYLNNLPESNEVQYFPYEMPDYKVQYRDILYIEVKSLTAEGTIEDVLQGRGSYNTMYYMQSESGQYLSGYTVDKEGDIVLPVVGAIGVADKSLPEIRKAVQHKVDSVFNHAYVDCKLLSFKYTVLGEARIPGTYMNYNNYLTVLEAIGRAGGVGDYGRRDRVLVVRPTEKGTKTYRIDLRDKNLLTSEAYFLMPNDVIIIEPLSNKIFNMNLPTFSFIVSAVTGIVTTTLLLINYFKK
jgi:polysaccharide biosynthesis/export protein